MMAVFLLFEHLVVEPRHTHDHQKVVEERFVFQNVVCSLVRVVLFHEAVEQDMAVGKFDPQSVVEPYKRIARRPFLLWAPAKWGP